MNQQTKVHQIKVRSRAERLLKQTTNVIELPERRTNWGMAFLRLDKLVRDLAVVGGLVLVIVAVRASGQPEAQSVFSALQESVNMQWDESLGKLSFVSNLLPEEIKEVWNEQMPYAAAPSVEGKIVHAWSKQEPYLLISTDDREIKATADGEIMGIAHGIGEEIIVRIRHDDHTESIYGNLESCCAEIGDRVSAGEKVGILQNESLLALEIRVDGKSVEPAFGGNGLSE